MKVTYLCFALLIVFLASCSKESDNTTSSMISIADGQKLQFGQDNVVDNTAQQVSITFTTNQDWKLTAFSRNGSWCTPSVTSGNSGTSTVSFTITANEDSEDRTNSFTITCGTASKTLKIEQKGKNTLTLSTDKFEVPLEGSTIDVQVLANIDYTIDMPAEYSSWIHQTTSRASVTTTHNYFTVDKSEEYDKREAVLYVKSSNGEEAIHIYQVGSSILVLSADTINISAEGGNAKITVSSNFDYGVDCSNSSWVHNITSRGVTVSDLNFTVDANTSYDSRSTSVTVYDKNSDKKETVTICQEGKVRPDNTPSYVDAVDLGLPSGLLWASMNVGASKNSEFGTYVAWGETEGATFVDGNSPKWIGKLDFNEENYKYYTSITETTTEGEFTEKKTYSGYTKYVSGSDGFKGFKDNKSTLDSEDDLATVTWGDKWRTPTRKEMQELIDNCSWTYGTIDNVNGYKVTGKNGKWIFIPLAGHCSGSSFYLMVNFNLGYMSPSQNFAWDDYCWTNSIDYLNVENSTAKLTTWGMERYYGLPVRPVKSK